MRKIVGVKGNSSLARDLETGAIININTQEISDARQRKLQKQRDKEELQTLKNDVAEIKQLLGKLIEKL